MTTSMRLGKDGKPKMSEKLFMDRIVKAAKVTGWLCYHTYDSRRSTGGWPDLVLVHAKHKRALFVEVKTEDGKVRPEQSAWIAALCAAGLEACVVRPVDWDRWFWDVLRGDK